ncbi:pyridoxal-phosphate dependent enzyme [bacterium]|nr:pyridoxal-phosphate dependent enzyme [bacterium]
MAQHPTLRDVFAARKRISDGILKTPLVRSKRLSGVAGADVYLKLENRQETGSFKLRGATNILRSLTAVERETGVVAVSSGNHGRAVAHVGAAEGIEATVCISTRVPQVKVAAMQALGATVVVAGPTQDDADAAARQLVDDGLVFVHPFDDSRVIAGQGTIGLELLDDLPEVGTVVVPLSGGGLMAGIAVAIKSADRDIRIIGVSQDRGPAMYDSIRAGRLTDVIEEDTLADALAGGLGPENHHSFAMCSELIDEILLVSENEIAAAMAHLHSNEGETVEGGGAVGVAAVLAGKVAAPGPIAVVVSGGNVDPAVLAGAVEEQR